MIKLGIIGTNWITEQFIAAAKATELFTLNAVYSRSNEQAKTFALKHNAKNHFESLEQLATSEVDAIYIASPNSLHATQAIQLMKAGKHVVCEKPLAANDQLVQQMFRHARENNVILFEAFMTAYLPNFQLAKEQLSNIGRITQAHISYCQYSSRYPKYLAGEKPNTFNPQFANGSIMDIGYYCVAATVELFGRPEQIKASASLLDSGVDGCGSAILSYADFTVHINHSKVSDSFIASEIQGEDGCLQIDKLSIMDAVKLHKRNQPVQVLSQEQHPNPMFYEAQAFAMQIKNGQMDEATIERSQIVAEVLTEIRKQTGVVFPSDD